MAFTKKKLAGEKKESNAKGKRNGELKATAAQANNEANRS